VSGAAMDPDWRITPPSVALVRRAKVPDSTATSQPDGNRTLAVEPREPVDPKAQTGIVIRPDPTRVCGLADLPAPMIAKVRRRLMLLPEKRCAPKSIRSIVLTLVRAVACTAAPFWPVTWKAVVPGWTARKAWSK